MSYRALITGGTGSIGSELAKQLDDYDITILSRNEKDQVLMRQKHPLFTYIIGDVRDMAEVLRACEDVDTVFHFAALKHIDICENQPQEAIKTNILGTLNIINACAQNECRLINMSSDKAVNPASVYGRTKSLAEAMVLQAGYINIRSGNVLWSNGSVLPLWKKQLKEKNSINITSKEMTRFFIHPKELIMFIIDNECNESGTYTVPMRSFRLWDIAQEFIKIFGNDKSGINVTGLREGERLHEYRDEHTSSEVNICTDINYIFK